MPLHYGTGNSNDSTARFKTLFSQLSPPQLRAAYENSFGLDVTRADLEAFGLPTVGSEQLSYIHPEKSPMRLSALFHHQRQRQHEPGVAAEVHASWYDLSFLLVPGLFTKSYPFYFSSLRANLQALGLHVWGNLTAPSFSEFDTDKPVAHNAAILRREVLAMVGARGRARPTRRVVVLAHSKGAVDFAAALVLYPELRPHIAAHVSLQGPHGGSVMANDLLHTNAQRSVALTALRAVIGNASVAALEEMTYAARRRFHATAGPYPAAEVPTVCLASWDKRLWGALGGGGGPLSLLRGPILLAPAIR